MRFLSCVVYQPHWNRVVVEVSEEDFEAMKADPSLRVDLEERINAMSEDEFYSASGYWNPSDDGVELGFVDEADPDTGKIIDWEVL